MPVNTAPRSSSPTRRSSGAARVRSDSSGKTAPPVKSARVAIEEPKAAASGVDDNMLDPAEVADMVNAAFDKHRPEFVKDMEAPITNMVKAVVTPNAHRPLRPHGQAGGWPICLGERPT